MSRLQPSKKVLDRIEAKKIIRDKSHAEYNIRFSERELTFWRNAVAKEESKIEPCEIKLQRFDKMYNKYWEMNFAAKQYLGLI